MPLQPVDGVRVSAGGNELNDEVRLACLDQVNRSTRRSAFAAPVAAALLVIAFGHAVSMSRMIEWAATVMAAAAVSEWFVSLYLKRRRRGTPVGQWMIGPVTAGLSGFAWASLPLFVFPPAGRYELWALYLIFTCSISALNVVVSASRRSYFVTFQFALIVPVELMCLLANDRTPQLLGLAMLLFFAVMFVLHHEVRTVVLSELCLRSPSAGANTQLHTLNAQLGGIALRDDVTGSANRVAFVDALGQVAAEVQGGDTNVGVVFLDLDGFKGLNDTLGREQRDEILVHVADRIRGVLRSGDLLARLDGDEFTVLLRGLHETGEAVRAAQRIHQVFESPFVISGRRIPVTASIGVTVSSGANEGPEHLLRQADTARYLTKESGRSRVELYVPTLQQASRRRVDHEVALREALVNGQIIAHFQPQVDLKTGRIVGAEALARWNHPQLGMLIAAEFMPLAEESDLVLEIDAVVRRSAIEARVSLTDMGCSPDFRIWCNVSARQLTTTDPFADLMDELCRAGCDPAGIGIELTESAVLTDVTAATLHLEGVRRSDIRVALDDFGTGHSSLALLKSIPVDELKVDKSFVSGIGTDSCDTAIIRATTALGRDLGLRVVAEGVETLAQAGLLGNLQCHRAQGYLWSDAVSLGKLHTLVKRTYPVRSAPDQIRLSV